MPEQDTTEANPPPSYDSVLKDDDLRNPQRRGPAELHGSAAAPRFPPLVATGKEGYHQQPQRQQQQLQPQPQLQHQTQPSESVFSDEDDVVLTPPTTAPPTVIDEDSDDERDRTHPVGETVVDPKK
ncbi:hypothetical protein PRZ48_013236 [Zasmidium cellare]|uniref:Uncharacterized protein n=1 Tax=Zasmidium cellare TaxID=395010 RepID=A0ABR0E3Y9_ZASCE|nr:hypothetical protein PRZ48_013236 [Zasmidium cellare]